MSDDRTPAPFELPEGEFLTTVAEAERLGWPWRYMNDGTGFGTLPIHAAPYMAVVVKRPEPVMVSIDLETLKVLQREAGKVAVNKMDDYGTWSAADDAADEAIARAERS